MTQRPAPSSTSAWSGRRHGAVHCRHQRAVHNLNRAAGPQQPQQALRARCQAAARGTQQTLQAAPANLRHFGFANNFNDLYELGEHVGSGSFGAVHKATKRSTGERVAVKTIKKRVLGGYLEPHFVKRVQHEVDLYNHMGRSLNVAHLYGAYEDDKCVQLVLQLCTGGELWTRIKRGAYSEVQAARVIREVLRAVAQCHSRGVVVRDVKPENFLFLDDSADAPLKMVDFGMAEYCAEGQQLTDRAGTAIYCAPEVLRQRYGLKCDVWSAGIIAYQLLTARLPFITDEGDFLASDLRLSRARLSNRDIFSAILYAPLDFTSQPWPALSPAAKDFVQLLLTRDPEQRPTAAAALQHPWLALPQQQASSSERSPAGSTAAGHTPGVHADAPVLDDTLVQRLQRYGTYSKLKQVSLSKVASFMATYDPSTLAQLRAALDSASINGSNGSSNGGSGGAGEGPPAGSFKIPYHKMVEVLHSGQFALSEVEVRQLLSSFTIDADGCMDASEWLAALTDWQQVQDTEAWEQLVTNAFDAIDQDHSGQLNVPELEALLCGDEDGCPFDDVVPSALRGMQQDMLTSSGDDSRTMPAASSAKQQPGSSTAQAQQSTATEGASDAKSRSPGPAPSGGAASSNGGSSGSRSGSPGDVVLDRPAFARLLRMAQQDRLELFESRRADARPGGNSSSSQGEGSTEGKDQ